MRGSGVGDRVLPPRRLSACVPDAYCAMGQKRAVKEACASTEGEPGCSSRGAGEVSEEAVSGAWFWRMGFSCGSTGKESACNEGNLGSIPGLGRSSREGKGYPLQYSVLENSMDCIVHGVEKSWTRLSDFHFASLEKNN